MMAIKAGRDVLKNQIQTTLGIMDGLMRQTLP